MRYTEIRGFSRKMRKNQTPFEKILWEKLRYRQLDGYKFLRQHPVQFDRKGNDFKFFILDFYCAEARLAIEIDGKIHDDQIDYDLWRQHILEAMNIKLLRFKNQELEQVENVIEKIRDHMRRHAHPIPSELAYPPPTPP